MTGIATKSVGTPLVPRRRPRQGHRPGALRLRAAGRGRRLRRARGRHHRRRRDRRHRPCPRARPPRRARGDLARQRAPPRRDRRRRAAALPVGHRPLPRADRRRRGGRDARAGARGRRPRSASTTRRASTTSSSPREHAGLYKPDKVNPSFPTDTAQGDGGGGARTSAEVQVDETYATAPIHNNAMEPHASLAMWTDGDLLLYDSIQGTYGARRTLAQVFELDPERVRVIAQHVGGGFGSKGTPRPQAVLAAIAARIVGRPVKCALRRQQMFASVGYRTPTIQRVRLGATKRRHAHRDRPRRVRADLDRARVRRADLHAHAHDVRGARPPDAPPAGRARRSHPVVDARARRVPRDVRARVGDRRARDRLRPRPDRAAHPQRAGRRPREGHAVLLAQPRRLPARGRRALRLGRPRAAHRRPLADRHRRRRLDLPRLPIARQGDRPLRGRRLRRRDRRHRHRHRRAHRAHPDRRRRARRRRRSGCGSRSATPTSASRPSPAARWAPRRGAPPSCAPARRCSSRARARCSVHTGDEIKAQTPALAPRLRRAVRRGAGRRRQRRGPRPARARRVRRRARHQPEDRALAVHRRHDPGASGWRCRRRASWTASSATTSTTTSRSTTSPPTRTSRRSTPSGSTRTTASSTRWAPRASARSASSAPRRRSPTRSSTPTGRRVRELPIRLDRVLA